MAGSIIEKTISEKLTGDSKKNALDLIAFFQANDIKLDPHGEDGEGWAVGGVVGESHGFLLINGVDDFPGPWTLWFNTCDFGESDLIDSELKETIWANVSYCAKCHPDWETCGGDDKNIFGKEFERLCHSPLVFTNPDSLMLEKIKKMLLILKMYT